MTPPLSAGGQVFLGPGFQEDMSGWHPGARGGCPEMVRGADRRRREGGRGDGAIDGQENWRSRGVCQIRPPEGTGFRGPGNISTSSGFAARRPHTARWVVFPLWCLASRRSGTTVIAHCEGEALQNRQNRRSGAWQCLAYRSVYAVQRGARSWAGVVGKRKRARAVQAPGRVSIACPPHADR